MFMLSRRKQGRNISYISKKRICNNVNSHVNSSESNNLNTSKSDNVIGSTDLPRINVHDKISFDTIIMFQKETDADSSISIND